MATSRQKGRNSKMGDLDVISPLPESLHMITWVMSDRAIPRSLRMMQGFGVHTFPLITAQGKARFVTFHGKPLLNVQHTMGDTR